MLAVFPLLLGAESFLLGSSFMPEPELYSGVISTCSFPFLPTCYTTIYILYYLFSIKLETEKCTFYFEIIIFVQYCNIGAVAAKLANCFTNCSGKCFVSERLPVKTLTWNVGKHNSWRHQYVSVSFSWFSIPLQSHHQIQCIWYLAVTMKILSWLTQRCASSKATSDT
jgi:hypothetical protein